jgi:hypothetical protein
MSCPSVLGSDGVRDLIIWDELGSDAISKLEIGELCSISYIHCVSVVLDTPDILIGCNKFSFSWSNQTA